MLDPENDQFRVETKPSNPVFWQGRTVNLLEDFMFFSWMIWVTNDDMGGSPWIIMDPQAGWMVAGMFGMENPMQMDDLEAPPFQETSK